MSNQDYTDVGEIILDITKSFSDRIAIEIHEKVYSYRDLYEYSSNLIHFLNLRSETQVAIMMERTINLYSTVYACAASGKTCIYLHHEFDLSNILYMLELTEAKLIIVDNTTLGRAIEISQSDKALYTIVHFEEIKVESTRDTQSSISTRSPYVYVMFTSGSTGVPKAVRISHRQLLHYLNAIKQQYRPSEFDRFSQVIELTFDLSMHDIFLAWTIGSALVVFNGNSYIELGKYVEEKVLTFWLSVPSMGFGLERTKQLTSQRFQSLKVVIFCGEPLPTSIATSWSHAAPNARIENMYGPTEATIGFTTHSYSYDSNRHIYPIVPIGKPMENLSVLVMNHQFQECQVGEIGELWLSGIQVISEYYNKSVQSKNPFVETSDGKVWYRTGDWVVLDERGILHFKGRIDDQIQIRGQRVERLELEIRFRNVLDNIPLAIIPSPVTDNGLILGVTLICIPSEAMSNASIQSKCAEYFHPPLYPTAFVTLKKFPHNANGKVDYKKLIARYQKKVSFEAYSGEYND